MYGPDGSRTVTLQHEPPEDPTAAANWLPTPLGEFRPIMRLYQPKPEVLDGSYQVPPIHRT